jgi:hypothetical protein
MQRAYAAAISGSAGSAARNAAITAVTVHPVAVICCMPECPAETLTTRRPSVTCKAVSGCLPHRIPSSDIAAHNLCC